MSNDVEILKAIHFYARAKLSEAEIDKLWMGFLKNPEYLDWLIIEVNSLELSKDSQGHFTIHEPLQNAIP